MKDIQGIARHAVSCLQDCQQGVYKYGEVTVIVILRCTTWPPLIEQDITKTKQPRQAAKQGKSATCNERRTGKTKQHTM